MIVETIERPPAGIVQGSRDLLAFDSTTCAAFACPGRFNTMTAGMPPPFVGIRRVGTAMTVKTLPADLAEPDRQKSKTRRPARF